MNIIANPLQYYSHGDESAFFSWLQSISCVKSFRGLGGSLIIELDMAKIDREGLCELIALFFRFGNDMKEFQNFAHMPEYEWINNPKSYWYERVFRKMGLDQTDRGQIKVD